MLDGVIFDRYNRMEMNVKEKSIRIIRIDWTEVIRRKEKQRWEH